jgi:hypothetical protein
MEIQRAQIEARIKELSSELEKIYKQTDLLRDLMYDYEEEKSVLIALINFLESKKKAI